MSSLSPGGLITVRALMALACAMLSLATLRAFAETQTESERADDLLVVHCLLPGQIRRLGNRTTYMSPRRPVRTTALDCRVRGGEYALDDEAGLRAALSVWLEQAQAGDPEAQTTLGELFEQGLGVPPDYEAARVWYERAAAQNYSRALINLGNLYERGLGVAADAGQALAFYRRASGLPDTLAETMSVDAAVDVAPVNAKLEQEVASLRAELASLSQERRELDSALQATSAALREAKQDATDRARAARQAGYEEGVTKAAATEAALAAREVFVRELEGALERREERIAQLNAALSALAEDRMETQELTSQLAAMEARREMQAAALDRRRQELRELEGVEAELRNTLEAQLDRLQNAELESAERLAAVESLLGEVDRLRANQLRAIEPAHQRIVADVDVAGPAIAMIEPQLSRTRGLVKVSLPAPTEGPREVIGRVTAPAGLLTLKVNGAKVEPNTRGVFTYRMPPGERGLDLVAIDQQGKRADLSFEWTASIPDQPVAAAPAVDLGSYHALLIGNSRYQYLPALLTPQQDIGRLAAVLEQRYGFQVTTLRDATRYEILSALNRLREQLTSEDNLLVYYAGHGELDDTNMRGHWLPVDAEPTNTANWISNVAITDILNVIKARQVMLVVDSCYSGTMTRSSIARLGTGMTDKERETWLRMLAEKRSRVVLTSGGMSPVLDGGGGRHSVFAKALLAVLDNNAELLTGRALYEALAARVAHAASQFDFEQIPAYAPIARAGHEAGDFVLLPRST